MNWQLILQHFLIIQTIKQIEKLAKSDDVKDISYLDPLEAENQIDYSLDEIMSSTKIDTIHDTLGINGDGVTVGIFDAGYINLDENISDLPKERFTVLSSGTEEADIT